MESYRAQPKPGQVEAAAVGEAGQPEWLEIIRAVSVSLPDQPGDLWLGRLVLEVQKASDWAVATARRRADTLIDEARSEALVIRKAGRRRTESIERVRALVDGAQSSSVNPTGDDPPEPPQARVADGAPAFPKKRGRDREAPATARPAGAESRTDPRIAQPSLPEPSLPNPAAAMAVTTGDQHRSAACIRVGLIAVVGAIVVVLAALGFVAFEHYVATAQERAAQHRLASRLVGAESVRAPAARPAVGAALGFLDVPRLAIRDESVIEGATLANLRQGPAHDSASRLPGQTGAVVIMGHRRTYGGPFGRLNELRTGDIIDIKAPGGIYVYRVFGLPRIVHRGLGAVLQFPPAAQVQASGGPAGPVNETLILATGADFRGASFEVVMATLDQGATVSSPLPRNSQDGGTRIRPIPGDWVGLPLAWLWLVIVGGAIYLGRRFRARLRAPWMMYVIVTWCGLVALYQVYGALDRILPGTF